MVVYEVFRVHLVKRREVLRHIGEKDRDVDDPIPRRSSFFHDRADVAKDAVALSNDVVSNNLAGRIEFDARNDRSPDGRSGADIRRPGSPLDVARVRQRNEKRMG